MQREMISADVVDPRGGGARKATIAFAVGFESESPALAARVRPGGAIVLSGVLAAQAGEVIASYAPWFRIDVWDRDEDWVALAGIRNPASAG